MNWDAIGAVGEILGALAVFVSLLYLALQIRVQNRESRIASSHEIIEAFRQGTSKLSDPEIAKIYVRAIRGLDGLEEWELMSFIAVAQLLLRVWEEAFYQYSEQRLYGSLWKAMETQYSDWVSAKGMQELWVLRKGYFRVEFREYVDCIDLVGRNYHISPAF